LSSRERKKHATSCEFRADARSSVSIRQHTSAYVSIRQHAKAARDILRIQSGCEVIRQHTSAYVSIRQHTWRKRKKHATSCEFRADAMSSVSIQHMSAYVSTPANSEQMRGRPSAYSIRQHTSAHSIRQHTCEFRAECTYARSSVSVSSCTSPASCVRESAPVFFTGSATRASTLRRRLVSDLSLYVLAEV
jgi:hypothetical protein